MLDEARRWAETQFGTAELGDARRTHRLVSIMAAIARAPDESLPRQLGSLANAKAGYRLFDCGAVTRTAVMDPHVGPACRTRMSDPHVGPACRAVPRRGGAASDRPHGSGRHDPRFLAASHAQGGRPRRRRPRHRVLGSQLSGRAALGRNAGPRPPDDLGAPAQGRHAPDPRVGGLGRHGRHGRPPSRRHCLCLGRGPGRRPLRASRARAGGRLGRGRAGRSGASPGSGRRFAHSTAGRPPHGRPMGASSIRTKTGAAVVCGAWRELELLPPRNGPRGRTPIRVRGVRVWNDRLAWLLLTTRPIESLDQALEIVSWSTRRWIVEEFHKAWKTGCRAEERRLPQADRLVPLLGALAIVAVRLLTLRDAARRDGPAPADAPVAALKILAAKLQRPAECFGSNRAFLRGVAQLGGFLARTSDGEPGWQTLWKGWSVLMTLVEGYELAQTITSAT